MEVMHQAERGLFELQRGRPIFVTTADSAVLLAAVEGLEPRALSCLKRLGHSSPRLVVTAYRVAAMRWALTNGDRVGGIDERGSQIEDAAAHVCIGLNGSSSPDEILRLSSASGNHAPHDVHLSPATEAEAAGVELARMGRLLPAVVAVTVEADSCPPRSGWPGGDALLAVTSDEIRSITSPTSTRVRYVSGARVPLEQAEDARVLLFREANGLFEHVAVVLGDLDSWSDAVPVRLHSACITGDLLGSLRCDCGEQLRRSLETFAQVGCGVLLYLAHEGRSIGLANKLRAYAIQEEGLDTVDADCALGFGPDERGYVAAAEILRHLGLDRIRLLTNNPDKVRAMEENGIRVDARTPLHGSLNAHNLPYVSAKARRAGHWLEEMLSGSRKNR